MERYSPSFSYQVSLCEIYKLKREHQKQEKKRKTQKQAIEAPYQITNATKKGKGKGSQEDKRFKPYQSAEPEKGSKIKTQKNCLNRGHPTIPLPYKSATKTVPNTLKFASFCKF